MLEEIQHVKTGEVTYAVRDTHIDDKEIHERVEKSALFFFQKGESLEKRKSF